MTLPDDFGSSCEAVRALLSRFGDGELDAESAAPLRGHLLDCADCRGRYAEQQNLRAWMVPSEAQPAPRGFAQDVARLAFDGALESGGVAGPSGTGVLRPRLLTDAGAADSGSSPDLMSFVLGVVSAAAAVLLGLSIALGLAGQRTSGGELMAEPLPDVLRQLEALNRAEVEGVELEGDLTAAERRAAEAAAGAEGRR